MTLIKKNRCCSVFAMMPNWRHLSKKESKEGSILLCSLLQKSVSSLQRVESRNVRTLQIHTICAVTVCQFRADAKKNSSVIQGQHTLELCSDLQVTLKRTDQNPEYLLILTEERHWHWDSSHLMHTSMPAQTSFLDKKTLSHTSRVFTSHTEI